MKISKILFGVMAAFMLFTAVALHADEPTAQERWNSMSDVQKQELRDRYQQWQAMPPEQKKLLESNYEHFKVLSNAQKARVIRNYAAFKQLPPARQDEIKKSSLRFKNSRKKSNSIGLSRYKNSGKRNKIFDKSAVGDHIETFADETLTIYRLIIQWQAGSIFAKHAKTCCALVLHPSNFILLNSQ